MMFDVVAYQVHLVVTLPKVNARHGNVAENATGIDKVNNVKRVKWRGVSKGTFRISAVAVDVRTSCAPEAPRPSTSVPFTPRTTALT